METCPVRTVPSALNPNKLLWPLLAPTIPGNGDAIAAFNRIDIDLSAAAPQPIIERAGPNDRHRSRSGIRHHPIRRTKY